MNNVGLSGSILKLVAVICMVIDHVAAFILYRHSEYSHILYTFAGENITIIWIMRIIGRMAFPIFCFLLIEGYLHTRNKWKYILSLLLFAVISEIPFDLISKGCISFTSQNVFFSLALGITGIFVYDSLRNDRFNQLVGVVMIMVIVFLSRCEYGIWGFLCIMIMYLLRNHFYTKMLLGCSMLPISWAAMLSIIPLRFYNGKRGFIQGNGWKYTFYLFYPVHLLILWFIK